MRFSPPFRAVGCLFLLLAFARGQETRMVPFAIPSVGSFPDAVNVSWLNHRPAGKYGFVGVNDGHFVLGNGERIRFLGGGLIRGACFPSHDQATALAARLGDLGFNLVRVHHVDTTYAPNGFWDPAFKDKQHLDAGQLERFDFLVDALRQQGVYVNINLHVSRTFGEADGFPGAKQLPSMGKGITIFVPRAIELQKAYARDLLTHRNPYTGTRYVDEPAIAVVEINNEDSLVGLIAGGGFPRLPDQYEAVLTAYWNRWLAERCKDSAAVSRRWSGVNEPPGEELLTNGDFAAGGEGWLGENPEFMPVERVEAAPGGGPALHIRCLRPGKLAWTMQLHQIGLQLEDGKPYTFHCRMKSAKPAKVQVVARLDHADPQSGRYEVVGLNRSIDVTAEWQEFSFTFLARKPSADGNRIGFTFPNQTGEFWLADASLKAGGRIGGIAPGESLEARSVRRPLSLAESSPAQWRDWIECVCELESAYFAEMRRFLKEDLGVKCLVIGTQVSYGEAYGVVRESTMDYGDMHAYWEHPRFLGQAWDMKNWAIDNTPMVDVPERSTVLRLAQCRLAGKPYMVSEYNHPAPNSYASECWPLVAAIGAQQDWDGIVVHNYLNYGPDGWEAGHPVNLFDTATSPQKTPFVLAAAILFRGGGFPPSPAVTRLTIPEPTVPDLLARGEGRIGDLWRQAAGDNMPLPWCQLGVATMPTGDACLIGSYPRSASFEWQQVNWQGKANGRPRFTVEAQSVKAVTGAIANQAVEFIDVRLAIGASRTGYATVTLVALDGKYVPASQRLLLTVGGTMENEGWTWNEGKTMLTSWGKGPTLTEVIGGELEVRRVAGETLQAFALDGAGNRLQEMAMEQFAPGRWRFAFGQADTMWYEIVPRQGE